jgi:hypothetical protein
MATRRVIEYTVRFHRETGDMLDINTRDLVMTSEGYPIEERHSRRSDDMPPQFVTDHEAHRLAIENKLQNEDPPKT